MLLDNYRVLHGRNTFKGDRKHAVTWFESCGEPLEGNQKQKPDDFMNELINKTLVWNATDSETQTCGTKSVMQGPFSKSRS